MKSGSWSSYVSAGALGPDHGVPDDDEGPARVDATPDPLEELHAAGYRAYRDALPGGRWYVARWDETRDVPVGVALGSGATACEAWEDARRRLGGGRGPDASGPKF